MSKVRNPANSARIRPSKAQYSSKGSREYKGQAFPIQSPCFALRIMGGTDRGLVSSSVSTVSGKRLGDFARHLNGGIESRGDRAGALSGRRLEKVVST